MRSLFTVITFLFFSSPVFAKTIDGQWHAGIGDPTIFGWVTVAFYLLASFLSFRQYRRLKPVGVAAQFWLYLALLLLLLAINKQLDLQSLLTEVLREHALANGWYEKRGALQSAFVVFLGVSLLVILLSLRVFLAKSWQHYWLAWLGILMLSTFVLMRAASFHHFDILINTHLLGVSANAILEIGAILIIIAAALKRPYKEMAKSDVVVNNYLEIQHGTDAIECPKCAFPPLSGAVHGRIFKCKKCGHKYTLFIANL